MIRPVTLSAAIGKCQPVTSGETGIPKAMQKAAEIKSGMSFSDVRVHYNSPKPAELGALAYTMGNQVYVGPGQF